MPREQTENDHGHHDMRPARLAARMHRMCLRIRLVPTPLDVQQRRMHEEGGKFIERPDRLLPYYLCLRCKAAALRPLVRPKAEQAGQLLRGGHAGQVMVPRSQVVRATDRERAPGLVRLPQRGMDEPEGVGRMRAVCAAWHEDV